jgi:uracil-DNA glycosylase
MTKLSPFIMGCVSCRLCEGAAYQLPPYLYAGSSDPSVLVIAQNPGEIGDDKPNAWRFDLLPLTNAAETASNAEAIKSYYDVDFITSFGHNQMAKIFGDTWLTNGKFMYTNAVRCRTKKNAPPSEDMISNCMGWTAILPLPKIVVLMGKIAVKQFCVMVGKPELPPWKLVKLNKDKRIIHVLTIPHYAAMRTKEDMEKAKIMFEEAVEEAGI